MRTSEWIALAYFVYLGIVCWFRPIGALRRAVLTSASIVVAAAVVLLARAGDGLRDWAPIAYILAGYYLSALLFVAPSRPLEQWLMSWDRRLLGDPTTRFRAWPRSVLALLELIYMGCFLVIGGGWVVLFAAGHGALADHYWTLVVGAELGSFAPLAFVQTRPPWAVEPKPVLADKRIHDLAARMTQQVTIRVNTFPSGHVAGSLAVAFAVAAAMPWTGAALFALAVAIAVATVAGRYHYAIDAVAGAALTVLLWAVVVSFGLPHE